MGPAPGGARRDQGRHVHHHPARRKISHLDPQRTYSFAGLMAAALRPHPDHWKDDGKGNLTLVGDLAETPGTNVNDDCKVWEFKIKDGVKFEDGRPITSKEIAYGIARSFDPDLTGGPTYVQEWLADTAAVRHQVGLQGQQDLAAAGPDHAGREDAALRVRQAALRPAVRAVAAGQRAAAAGQGHRRQPRQPAVLVRAVQDHQEHGRRASWCSSATSTGTRPPTRCATSTRTSSSGRSARTADAQTNRVIADNGDDQYRARLERRAVRRWSPRSPATPRSRTARCSRPRPARTA